MIRAFKGDYKWLSNFDLCEITYKGLTYSSTEAAYQAQKTLREELRIPFTKATPSQSKKMGRALPLRYDWELVKLGVMEDVLRRKFAQKPWRDKLVATGLVELVEWNTWCDIYYGRCTCGKHNGEGQNHLGELLMKIRDEVRLCG